MLSGLFNILIVGLIVSGGISPRPDVSVLSKGGNGLKVSYSFRGFGYEIVNIDGKSFLRFNTEDIAVFQDLGKPELPAWRDFIEVPYDAEVSLKIVEIKTEKVSLKEKGIKEKVIPSLPPVPKVPGAKQEFVFDKKQYETDEFYPTRFATVSYAGEMRGHQLYTVEIFPIRYNPVRDEIEVVTSITLEVTFDGGNLSKTYRELERLYSPYFEYSLSKKVLNYGVFSPAKRNPALPVVYLLVTPAEWVDSLRELIEWNRQKGYWVKIARIPGDIPSGDTLSVRNYLRNAYLNWSPAPTFVVLVGDVDRIGYFNSDQADNPANDLKYEDLDLDEQEYFPDVYVGRLSVANVTELGRVVRKTVRYEKVLWSQGTQWAKRAFFIASADPSWHTVAEGTHNYCIAKVRSYGMIADSVYAYYTANSPTIITNAINSGRSLVTYSGHGSETGWADYNGLNYSVSNIYNNLTNADMYAFVQTYACFSGRYTVGECFSEAWIRAPEKGAVASMASSVTSYWYEDDILQRRTFDELFDTGYVWIKGAINEGKIELYRHYSGGGRTKRYFQMYNLMGDPSVYLWTQEPKPLALNYPSVVPLGPSQVQLTVTLQDTGSPVDGALVSAHQKGQNVDTVFDARYTNASGLAVLNISPANPDTIWFTVSGYNLWPQRVYAMVSSEGPYVSYRSSYIQELAGYPNDRINPGESIRLYVMLKNFGQDGATNVQAVLSTTNSNVTITDNTAYYGDIAPSDSTYGSDYFEFTVSASAVDQENIPFTITITSNEGTWSANFSYTVYAPILSYQRVEVIDNEGNGNGVVDPGETVTLRVYARN
ncbi:MAG: C25 family cysteine peptidase, partial [candidate division WOR-3 bacterium]